MYACFTLTHRDNLQPLSRLNLLTWQGDVSAVRYKELIVEPTEDRKGGIHRMMAEHSEHLFFRWTFLNAVEVIKSCESCPTDIKC